ncbi:MAG: iron-regulated protein [Akkermansiaceae bacterium]|nr:iron-regulated protein [Verrucomicrobiales bacterium]
MIQFFRNLFVIALVFAATFTLAQAESASSPAELKREVIANYCAIVSAAYSDSLALARELETSIHSFVEKPGSDTLASARKAWIRCRTIYLQTEVTRFCDGPIEAVEGQINAWPIDENYIDYTVDDASAGVINQPEQFPKITSELVLRLNEKGGEKNISTGFHAIEFLLWGQDLSDTSAGERAHSDYVPSSSGPGKHAARRARYLMIVAALLVENLAEVESAWAANQPGNHRAKLQALPADEALAAILKGVGSLSGAELGGERLLTPYTTKEQEEEHSCFSDTTHLDFICNQTGVQNVFFGRFTRVDGSMIEGPGLLKLVETVSQDLAATLNRQITEALSAFRAIPVPFDQAIAGRDTAAGRRAIKGAIDAMRAQTLSIAKAATALGIRLNL